VHEWVALLTALVTALVTAQVLSFDGGLLHGGDPIVRGTR
jgi:hypothetical protein